MTIDIFILDIDCTHIRDEININLTKTIRTNKQGGGRLLNVFYSKTFSGAILLNALLLVVYKKCRCVCPVNITDIPQKIFYIKLREN